MNTWKVEIAESASSLQNKLNALEKDGFEIEHVFMAQEVPSRQPAFTGKEVPPKPQIYIAAKKPL